MDNQFLINFNNIKEIDVPSGNFFLSIDNPIEIQDIKNEDSVLKAIKSFPVPEMNNIENIVNVKKIHFDITDSNKKTICSGEGMISENQIDVLELKCNI